MRLVEDSDLSRSLRMAKDNWDALTARNTLDRVLNLALSPPFGGFGGYANHGPRSVRKLCLTFDDGPNRPCTEELLDALDELGAPATFFAVGVNAMQHPDLLQRAVRAGHAVGNHSMRHRRKSGLMPYGGDHIDEAEKAIADAIGRVPRLYRPPWGWLSPFENARLKSRGYTVVGWDVYTRDWQIPECDGEAMAAHVVEQARNGSFILFHDGYPLVETWEKKQTVRAVKALVPALRDKGLEFATVPDVLGIACYA